MEALRGWGEFLRLGLPGAAMICIEWLSFEIAALVVGSIDEVQLAINSVVISFMIVFYMVSDTFKMMDTACRSFNLGWDGSIFYMKRTTFSISIINVKIV